MAKLETPAAVPAALRPPRPAVRMRAGSAAPDESDASHAASAELSGDAYVARHFPEDRYPGDCGPEVVEVLELDDDEVIAEPADGVGAPLSEEAITERGFDASTFGLPRAGGTKLPMASLEMPSSSRLDLTPSPVPRVALSPATGAVDISLVPGPHASRNLPTLAAHHVLGRRPARRPASAITFPPHQSERRGATESPRLGAGLAKDVRSSKREIVLGLAIGLGLSLVLAAVGQAYLREEPVASSPPEVESLVLTAKPEAAPSPADDTPAAAPASGEPPPPEPMARAAVTERAVGERGPSSPSPRAHQRRTGLVSNGLNEPDASRAGASAAAQAPVARRAHARRDDSPAARASGEQAGKSNASSQGYDDPPPARAPMNPASMNPASLSPAESAGLGLDLPL